MAGRQMMDYGRDNGTYDLSIENGDFVRVESTAAHQVSILLDAPGEYPDSRLSLTSQMPVVSGRAPISPKPRSPTP